MSKVRCNKDEKISRFFMVAMRTDSVKHIPWPTTMFRWYVLSLFWFCCLQILLLLYCVDGWVLERGKRVKRQRGSPRDQRSLYKWGSLSLSLFLFGARALKNHETHPFVVGSFPLLFSSYTQAKSSRTWPAHAYVTNQLFLAPLILSLCLSLSFSLSLSPSPSPDW